MTDCVDEASVRQILLKAKPDAFVSMMQVDQINLYLFLSLCTSTGFLHPMIHLSTYPPPISIIPRTTSSTMTRVSSFSASSTYRAASCSA